MTATANPDSIFVYGTLKRGQSRETCWPRKPRSIESATVRGTLFDLGPYPGLIEGQDVIVGEAWQFAETDMPATLATLDEIEDFHNSPDDEYRRVIVECMVKDKVVAAWTYQYARGAALATAQRIAPNANGLCEWRKT